MTSSSPQDFERERGSCQGAITMYDDSSLGNGPPFIRLSRVVSRLHPDPPLLDRPSTAPEERYGPNFWERIIRQPSFHTPEIPGMMSSYPAWRPDTDWSSLPEPILEPLPPPSVLCPSRRRKKKKEELLSDKGGVRQHIEELRKKQGNIDRLKSMKWSGRRPCDYEELPPEMIRPDTPQEPCQDFLRINQDQPGLEESPFNINPPYAKPRDLFWINQDQQNLEESPFTITPPYTKPRDFFRINQDQHRSEESPFTITPPYTKPRDFFGINQDQHQFEESPFTITPSYTKPREHFQDFFGIDQDQQRLEESPFTMTPPYTKPRDQQRLEESPFTITPPYTKPKVTFPWMTPSDDVTSCYSDRGREGCGSTPSFFLQEE